MKSVSPQSVIVALDTTTPRQGIALARGRRLLAELEYTPELSHTETLVKTLAELLAGCGLGFAEIGGVGVVTGPGSFAGIRIGMAAAAGLADALAVPVAGRQALELLALHPFLVDGPVCCLLDARRDRVYAEAFLRRGGTASATSAPVELSAPQLDSFLRGLGAADLPLTVLGDPEPLSPAFAGVLAQPRLRLVRPCVALCCLLVAALSEDSAGWLSAGAVPEAFYLRPPDIRKKGA